MKDLDRFYRGLMQAGTDYGIIPGTPKPSLWKPGAELLRLWAGLTPVYENDDSRSDRKMGYIHWLSTCRLLNKAGEVVGELSGSCNSHEAKYRWRWVWERELPPNIDKETLVSKKIGNKEQDVKYRLENDNPADLDNTILKMAQKRAFIGDILMVTGASRIFTQIVEEEEDSESLSQPPAVAPGAPAAQAAARPEMPLANGLPKQDRLIHDQGWLRRMMNSHKPPITESTAMAKLGIEQWAQLKITPDEAWKAIS